jgi:DMSO/TMAO reductase YedYZ molybdopterin-dependent catalytic subunit
MPFMQSFNRRQFLQMAGLSSTLLLGGCGSDLLAGVVGQVSEPLNQRLDELLLNPHKPVPELPISKIEPEKLIVNTFDFTPVIDPKLYRLTIDGEVNNPMQLGVKELYKLPLTSVVMRHVCVEGWAAIVQWGGVRLRDLIQLAQPKETVRYVYFQSADGYYESWDLRSCLHPQTLMAYQKNGAPLPIENGAPLRLAAPIKLGYKHSKWVTRIMLTSNLLPQRGYWEDRGYEWFAGL